MQTQADHQRGDEHERNAVPPLRADNHPIHAQPRPGPMSMAEVIVAIGGYVFAMLGPLLVARPFQEGVTHRQVWLAFTMTVIGVLIALVSCTVAYRRTRNWSWLVLGVVPGLTVLMCGMLIATTMIAPAMP